MLYLDFVETHIQVALEGASGRNQVQLLLEARKATAFLEADRPLMQSSQRGVSSPGPSAQETSKPVSELLKRLRAVYNKRQNNLPNRKEQRTSQMIGQSFKTPLPTHAHFPASHSESKLFSSSQLCFPTPICSVNGVAMVQALISWNALHVEGDV